jgi:hypothetical protein
MEFQCGVLRGKKTQKLDKKFKKLPLFSRILALEGRIGFVSFGMFAGFS